MQIAECFAQRFNVTEQENNVVKLNDGAVYEFTGDGRCKDNYNCYAVVYPLGKTTKIGEIKNSFNVYLKTNSDGYIEIAE